MQLATNPFPSSQPHPHYHSYYQLLPPGAHDIELKRQYLSLLPPHQIIEICLTFDAYVPPYAKITIWPSDLSVAIAALQKNLSLSEKTSEASIAGPDTQAQPDVSGVVDPRPPDREHPSTPSVAAQKETTSSDSAADPVPSESTPTIQSQPNQPLQTITPQPYAYPHTPYYPPGYTYPFAYPSPQNGFLHPTPYPPHPTPYASTAPPPPPHPPLPESLGTDDLPSYEEMIVEALIESTDPDGSAPKDLFTWMAARYPLQSNFRPSASQALQKAFKRGRFEKSSNGKYRLNATWEGGNTSRRTTRRPQTQSHASSGPTNRSSGSPFTHTPLVHQHQHHPPHVVATPHTGQPHYPYAYPGFTPYGLHHPHAPASNLIAEPAPLIKNSSKSATSPGDSAAAYETAQNILKAINFGGLLKLPLDERNEEKEEAARPMQSVGNGVEQLLVAGNTDESAKASSVQLPGSSSPSPLHASAESRAELQAQLALLFAQLAELAQTEQCSQPIMSSLVADRPPLSSEYPDDNVNTLIATKITPPDTICPAMESDDDDLEEVI